MQQKNTGRIIRWVAAIIVCTFFLYWAAFFASLSEWSLIEDPAERWRQEKSEIIELLIASAALSAIGIGCARLMLRKSPLSWWLLLSLTVPAWQVQKYIENGVIAL